MRISIYIEAADSAIGGLQLVAATLAEALAKNHQVDLFHRIPSLTVEKLATTSRTDLTGVQLHYVNTPDNRSEISRRNPVSHYRSSKNFLADLSKGYDVFVAIMHDVPPFSYAKKSALIVLFPTPTAPYVRPEGGLDTALLRKHPERYLYQSWLWKKRMATYEIKTAISDFSRRWAQKRWGIDCKVVYPPVNTAFREVEKEKIILSVGRFAIEGEGLTKKQEQMLETYGRLELQSSPDWQYFCVGGMPSTPEHQAYVERLSALATSSGAHVKPNIDWNELTDLYERASIFWHAAGYGEDSNMRPIFLEHFGIATVEAMAAGCVPVVINKGGQPEIVHHGVNGFHWETLGELKHYTEILIKDPSLRRKMSEAARVRAAFFSRDAFTRNFVAPLLGATADQTGKSEISIIRENV